MTETKWTPGPWFAVNDGTKREPMMAVKAARISGQTPRHEVAMCATGDNPQEMENANANLIAAAPDLYAATNWDWLIELENEALDDDQGGDNDLPIKLTVGQIRALMRARRKARGE